MKKIIFIIILIISFFILWTKGNKMREIKTEIEISAPPEKVWDVLININNWSKWNSTINKIDGTIEAGNKLTIVMKDNDGKDGTKYMPIVIKNDKPIIFEWRAKMISEFLFTNGRVFELEKNNNGTKLINKETFRGILVPLFWNKLNDYVPKILEKMNIDLKKEVEKN